MDANSLRELLDYNPDTGVFTRRVRTSSRVKVGDVAGRITNTGYVQIRVQGKPYYGHRLAWLYMTGELPEDQIDHINGIRDDNRFSNLRCVSAQGNARNQAKAKNNTSGQIGVSFKNRSKQWYATIMVDGKNLHLGSSKNKEEAIMLRLSAEQRYGYHKGHGKELC